MTTVQPVASAGPSFQACMSMGKFLLIAQQTLSHGARDQSNSLQAVPWNNLAHYTHGFALSVSKVTCG